MVVLSGRKVIFDTPGKVTCEAGAALAIPAPGSFNLCNERDVDGRQYRALIIPFTHLQLERLRKIHDFAQIGQHTDVGVLKFTCDEVLLASLKHYLASPAEPRIQAHRLIEVLLVLAEQDARLLSYSLNQESWSQKVQAVLAADLGREWQLAEVCHRLATSESSLRRRLHAEGVGFRDLLYELRLSSALAQLLQTSAPVYQIAYDCGYQSVSRFTSNFRKRFGLPPSEFRASVSESEQILAVTEQVAMS